MMIHQKVEIGIIIYNMLVYSFFLLDVQELVLLFGYLIGYVGLTNVVAVISSIILLIKGLFGG